MPISECTQCGGNVQWGWEEAFCKFGFLDGDGQVETWNIADALTEAGFQVTVQEWGMHNTIITHIFKNEIDLIGNDVIIGYDDPRKYLPSELIKLLDEKFPSHTPDPV